jgi:hypothetical protein
MIKMLKSHRTGYVSNAITSIIPLGLSAIDARNRVEKITRRSCMRTITTILITMAFILHLKITPISILRRIILHSKELRLQRKKFQ